MAKIYLPQTYLNKPCYIMQGDYIRVYNTTNTGSSSNTYWDVYFKNDYYVRRGTSSFSSSTLCDNVNTYTSDVIYRYDFDKILFTFILLCFIIFFIPTKIVFRMFRRWR